MTGFLFPIYLFIYSFQPPKMGKKGTKVHSNVDNNNKQGNKIKTKYHKCKTEKTVKMT